MTKAAFPAERAADELDPESAEYRALLDPSPAAQQEWIETFLTVPTPQGAIVRFKLFPQQKRMLYEQTGRDITVKGRQTRASSLFLARNLRRMTNSFGLKCLVGTHSDQATAMFRDRIRHHIQDLARAGLNYEIVLDNKDEIVIGREMQNRYVFASGAETATGRSYSAHIVHLSEVSFWRPETAGELIGSITPAVPGWPHGWFDLESTPNGAEGVFYEYAKDAESEDPLQGWTVHLYPWHIEPRYQGGTEDGCDLRLDRETFDQLVREFDPSHRERNLMEEFSLTIGQILWRRWRSRELERTGVPFLQEYVESLDSCWITGESNFFAGSDGKDHLSWYRDQCVEPFEKKDSLTFKGANVTFHGPNLSIWELPDPASKYACFADLAEGGTGRDHDFSALAVVNAMTRHHVATLRLKCAPADFAAMCCAVAQFYNQAMLAGERGGYGSAALDRIRELGYPNVYYHVDYNSASKEIKPWIYATPTNREELLNGLRESIFDHSYLTRDKIGIGEMGTFDWHKLGMRKTGYKAQARKRRHDDCVISQAGALFVAKRIYRFSGTKNPDEPEEIVVGQHGVVMSRGPVNNRRPYPMR